MSCTRHLIVWIWNLSFQFCHLIGFHCLGGPCFSKRTVISIISDSFSYKFKYDAKLSSKVNGGVKKGVIFATYSSLIGESQNSGKYSTRMSQLLRWCGSDFDGVVSFSS